MKNPILSATSATSALLLGIGFLFPGLGAYGKVGDENSSASARSAAELYEKNCASCHGKDGRSKTLKGRFRGARDLSDPEWQSSVSDERIFNSIINGRGKMPSFGKKVSEAEVESLVTYVRDLKKE
jgi:mono/diheme cytochrome c family protein